MARLHDCIYCGGQTGSGEHVFPAALGGRQVHNGILCKKCNGYFSDLDGRLADSLRTINGLIGVQSHRDKKKEPPRATMVHPAEGPITVDRYGRMAQQGPILISEETRDEDASVLEMSFADDKQFGKWKKEQEATGQQIRVIRRTNVERLVDSTVPTVIAFGNPQDMREIGRIALNFLALFRPHIARLRSLDALKAYILGRSSPLPNEAAFVFWTPSDAFDLPDMPSPFVHQILLVLESDNAYARVRFFGAFDFVVRFGHVENIENSCRLFTVNPLAQGPKAQFTQDFSPGSFPGTVPPGFVATTEEAARKMMAAVARLFREIGELHWSESTAGLADAINRVRGQGAKDHALSLIRDILSRHQDKAFGLMTDFVQLYKAHLIAKPKSGIGPLTQMLDSMVKYDRGQLDGLSSQARVAKRLITDGLCRAMADVISSRNMTDADLRDLFRGQAGVSIVVNVLEQLFDLLFALPRG